jgi:ABC-2 type transport system permease protein
MSEAMSRPAGVIHDIGYQRYQGARLAGGYPVRSLYTHSLRTAYGLGRTAKAKIFPWLVAGIVGLVAVVVTAVRAGIGESVVSYAGFPDAVVVLVVLFSAIAAPELVSRDLRSGVLPLYFSRPLSRSDYALAKLAALVSAIWLLLAGPQLLMFLGGVFSVDGWGAVWDEAGEFAGGLGHAAVHAVVVGAIALLISSLVGRRAVAAGAVVAAFLVTTPAVGVLSAIGGESARQLAGLFSPSTLMLGVRGWLFEGTDAPYPGDFGALYGGVALALVLACIGLLLLRYRRVQQ